MVTGRATVVTGAPTRGRRATPSSVGRPVDTSAMGNADTGTTGDGSAEDAGAGATPTRPHRRPLVASCGFERRGCCRLPLRPAGAQLVLEGKEAAFDEVVTESGHRQRAGDLRHEEGVAVLYPAALEEEEVEKQDHRDEIEVDPVGDGAEPDDRPEAEEPVERGGGSCDEEADEERCGSEAGADLLLRIGEEASVRVGVDLDVRDDGERARGQQDPQRAYARQWLSVALHEKRDQASEKELVHPGVRAVVRARRVDPLCRRESQRDPAERDEAAQPEDRALPELEEEEQYGGPEEVELLLDGQAPGVAELPVGVPEEPERDVL